MPRPTGRWRRFESRAFFDGVVVDVDDVVEHAHRRRHGLLQLVVIDRPFAVFQVCWDRFTEPRLHGDFLVVPVFSVISVHRLDECTTPTCCCGERMLQASLKVIQGAGLEQHRASCATGPGLHRLEQSDLAAGGAAS